MTAPRITPTTAVQLQDELVRFWNSTAGQRFMSGWQKARVKDGMGALSFIEESRSRYEMLAIAGARLYLVTEPMLALADHAARSMPSEPMLKTDPPCPNGLMLFERGIASPDVRGKLVVTAGILWKVVDAKFGEKSVYMKAGTSVGGACVAWTFYSDLHDPRDEYFVNGDLAGFPSRLVPVHEDREVFGTGEHDPQAIAQKFGVSAELVTETYITTRRLALALWSLIRDYAECTPGHVERHTRRGLKKSGSPVSGEVVVVKLRREKHETEDHAPGSVEWSHRWIVSGHWRNQWYATLGVHRLKWIRPFVKGPEDKPVVVKRRVHHLSR